MDLRGGGGGFLDLELHGDERIGVTHRFKSVSMCKNFNIIRANSSAIQHIRHHYFSLYFLSFTFYL